MRWFYSFFHRARLLVHFRLRILSLNLKLGVCEIACKKNFPPVTTLWHSGVKKLLQKFKIAFFELKTRVLFLTIFGHRPAIRPGFPGHFYFFCCSAAFASLLHRENTVDSFGQIRQISFVAAA